MDGSEGGAGHPTAATGASGLYARQAIVPAHVMVRPVADELVILSLESEEYFGLDAVGARMWHQLSTTPTVQAAFDALLAEYDVAPATLAHDLEKLVEELRSRKLLETVEPQGPG